MHIQVKMVPLPPSPPRPDLDLSGTGYCPAFNFRRSARAVTRFFDLALQGSGLRSTQFTILTAVAKFQPVPISKVGETLVIDPTTLTRSLGLMQKQGLIEISARLTRRQRFVTLTKEGEKALARALPAWRAAQQQFVQAIGSDYWVGFRAELERLAGVAVSLEGDRSANPAPEPSDDP